MGWEIPVTSVYGVGDAAEETTVGKEAGFKWGEALGVAPCLEDFLEECAPVS